MLSQNNQPRRKPDLDNQLKELTARLQQTGRTEEPQSGVERRGELAHSILGKGGIASYTSSFGIDITELKPKDVEAFLWARHFEEMVKKIKLPVAQQEQRENTFVRVEREVDEEIPKTTYESIERQTQIPTDNFTLGQLTDASQIPSLVRSEWLKEEVDPTLFIKQLTTGNLMEQQWMENTDQPKVSFETVKVKKLFVEPAPPIIHRPHAYVLLDVSDSIPSEDRLAVSRGLALAFLKYAHEQRAQMYLRPFSDSVGEPVYGTQLRDLRRIALKVCNPRLSGGTDIHWALRHAVADIRGSGSTTPGDVLLITDGLSRLDENPLIDPNNPSKNVLLHTIHLTDEKLPTDEISDEDDSTVRHLKTLNKWSSSVHVVKERDSSTLREPLTKEDLQEISKSLHQMQEEFNKMLEDLALNKLPPEKVDTESAVLGKRLTNLVRTEELMLQKMREAPKVTGSATLQERLETIKRDSEEALKKVRAFREKLELTKEIDDVNLAQQALKTEAENEERILEQFTPPPTPKKDLKPAPDPWEKAAELDRFSFWDWLTGGIRQVFDSIKRWGSR